MNLEFKTKTQTKIYITAEIKKSDLRKYNFSMFSDEEIKTMVGEQAFSASLWSKITGKGRSGLAGNYQLELRQRGWGWEPRDMRQIVGLDPLIKRRGIVNKRKIPTDCDKVRNNWIMGR